MFAFTENETRDIIETLIEDRKDQEALNRIKTRMEERATLRAKIAKRKFAKVTENFLQKTFPLSNKKVTMKRDISSEPNKNQQENHPRLVTPSIKDVVIWTKPKKELITDPRLIEEIKYYINLA